MQTHPRKASAPGSQLPLQLPGDIGAIAVDTNIYREYGFRIRSQPLAELPRVGLLGIQWLIPEFWEQELRKHLIDHAGKVGALTRDLQKSLDWADQSDIASIRSLTASWAATSPEQVAERLLAEHLDQGKVVRLATAWSAGPSVLRDYFDSRDPFEQSGAKKSEFPDAFALATLSHWAKTIGARVVVVTRDAGCIRACESSEFLIGTESLTDALAALRRADASRRAVIEEYEKLLAVEMRNERSDLRRRIDELIATRLPDVELDIDYETASGHVCEFEIAAVNVTRIEPIAVVGGGVELRVFSAAAGELTFSCELLVNVEATARFMRSHRHVRASGGDIYGAPKEHADGTVELQVIVTLQPAGTLAATTLAQASVRKLELQVRESDIDFGEVDAWEPPSEG